MEERRARRGTWWWALLAVLAGVAVVVAVVTLAGDDADDADGGDGAAVTDPSETAPVVTRLVGPITVECTTRTEIELTWATEHAESVELFVDDRSVSTGGPSGTARVPFPCDGRPHVYDVIAHGTDGQVGARRLTIGESLNPTTTTLPELPDELS
jgi:hypothetical protein